MSEQDLGRQTDLRLLEVRGNVTFADCLIACAANREFVQQWERLCKKRLVSTGINAMIDKATGYDMAVFREFADCVYQCVFQTLGTEV